VLGEESVLGEELCTTYYTDEGEERQSDLLCLRWYGGTHWEREWRQCMKGKSDTDRLFDITFLAVE
jgi:hypothetical protein